MADEEVVETTEETPKSNVMAKWLIGIALLVIAFLSGFVPMWLSNRQLSADIANRDKEIRRTQIVNTLSAATIYARRGEYETARKKASTFFTDIQAEMDTTNNSILTEQERIGVNRVLAERDEIITLLSRNDPASAERLSNAFIEYSVVVPNK